MAINRAIENLNKDQSQSLNALGSRHKMKKVIPAHYDVVGQALIKTLTAALGEEFTEEDKQRYVKLYQVVTY